MPVYAYKCPKCSHMFDHFARTISEAAPKCPKCGAEGLEKQFCTFSQAKKEAVSSCSTGMCSLARD
ncbi:MAG: hypothetical protein GQF41_2524 [Candidatus Rifleibacterium amylolyticum]|nr:MAG: hypothetical protein GQF41_2524 [Candidatus Rifleibacterium amylolyticum]